MTDGTVRTSAAAEELGEFLRDAVPAFRKEWPDEHSFEAQLAWQAILNEGRWVAPAWPVEHGGRGLTPAENVLCEQEVAAIGAPTIAGTLGTKNVGPTIIGWGTESQRRHLPRILSGEEIWCQGFSEPDAGSDLAGLRTRAVIDGDELVVNGEKVWTTNGMRATHCELLVRTDPEAPKHKGISALLTRLDRPGIERRPIRQMTGGSQFAAMSFHDVRIPIADLLGPLNEGWRVTTTTLAHERSGVAMFATRLEQEIVGYVHHLARSGLAAGLSGVARDEVARRYVEGRVVGIMGRKTLASVVAGRQPGPEQQVIKLAWSLLRQRFSETRFDVVGLPAAVGLDTTTSEAYLGARSATIAAGTTEVLKNILAERVLGLPREAAP
ncbi:MAG TPA: acyl-CoA dehydrogenase family protein [Acidimicrobiales bacterium]|nr:acyl-CoA dehydrogenase family protein [Acidimicrobiales bacterium]